MANLTQRVVKLEKSLDKTENRVTIVETNQTNNHSRLKRIESGVWFIAGSVLVALIGAVITLLAK